MIPDPLRVHNEVIFEGPQKMRIDIDCNETMTDEEWKECLEECYTELKDVTDSGSLIIYDMSDAFKKSCHMVCYDRAYPSSYSCKSLCIEVKLKVASKYAKYIDENVYHRTQHFRMERSYKYGTVRCKRVTRSDAKEWDYRHGLVGCVEGLDVVDVKIEIPQHVYSDTNIVIKSKWCRVRKITGNMIELIRLNSTYCHVCRRTHDSENPYMIVKGKTGFLYCRRSKEPTLFTVKENMVEL